MKLATKISGGFGALIVIALILGGMAVFSMLGVKKIATILVEQNVPEVGVANNVERSALKTMYEVRGYAYTEDGKMLSKGREQLKAVKDFLTEAKNHASKHSLPVLQKNAEAAEKETLAYEKLLEDTVAKTDAMAKDKAESLKAADAYMQQCYTFIERKAKEQSAAIAAAADEKKRKEAADLTRQISTVNDIVDIGNWIRIGTWQAIAMRDPALFTETEKKFDDVTKKLDELRALTSSPEDIKQINDCSAAGKQYLGCMQSFLVSWTAREELNKQRSIAGDAVLAAAKETAQAGMDDTTKGSGDAAKSLSTSSTVMITGLTLALIMGVALAYAITRSIIGPVNRVIAGLSSGAEQVTSASGQVASASQQMAQGASEQASSLEETSSSLEEMASMTKQNADNANQANGTAQEASRMAEQGVESMHKMQEAIDRIKNSASETAKIIKTIDEIAFQTNLLALNAAVEAARAGEAGKGFAVVAEEVRNLARRSAEAAKNTADLIEGAQKNADAGVQVTAEVAKNLAGIKENAGKVATLIAEIAAASKEQSQGITQVTTAVTEMDKVVQQNAANAEESASAAEELSSQAEEVNSMVGELNAIVTGSTTSGIQRRQLKGPAHAPAVAHGTPHKSIAPPAAHKAPARTQAQAKVRPESVIPLDESDLKEF